MLWALLLKNQARFGTNSHVISVLLHAYFGHYNNWELFVMKGILADVLKCLGDNKKHMRECTLTALDSWVAAAQLDKMVPYIIVTLGDQKTGSEGRKDLFDWLSKHVSKMGDPSEALPLLKPSASSLMVPVEIDLLSSVCLICTFIVMLLSNINI